MKYLVYDKYRLLLEKLEGKLFKNYKELEVKIFSFLIENDNEEIVSSVNKTIKLKIYDTKELLKKLDVDVSHEKISDYFFDNEFETEYKLLLKEKTKKIINALNLVNFTNINILSSRINTYSNIEILFPSYYKIKEYYKTKVKEIKNDSYTTFIKKFGKTLERITTEELEYINDWIAIEDTNDAKSPATISLESFKEIRFIRYVILTLEKNQIKTNNYKTRKLPQYFNLIQDVALYGSKPSDEILFDNPTDLYAEIDFILISNGLNERQRTLFYRTLGIRQYNPKEKDTKDVHKILDEARLLNEVSKYPYAQQDAIYNNTKNFEFNEDYYKHIEKYGKDNVYNAVFTVQNSLADTRNDVESWFNYTNKTNKNILSNLFTSTSKTKITYLFNLDQNLLK